MSTRKLTKSERNILSRLIHVESMDTLIAETGLKTGEIRDDITNLISIRYIEVYAESEEHSFATVTPFYDLDRLYEYKFRATKRGQSAIKDI